MKKKREERNVLPKNFENPKTMTIGKKKTPYETHDLTIKYPPPSPPI